MKILLIFIVSVTFFLFNIIPAEAVKVNPFGRLIAQIEVPPAPDPDGPEIPPAPDPDGPEIPSAPDPDGPEIPPAPDPDGPEIPSVPDP